MKVTWTPNRTALAQVRAAAADALHDAGEWLGEEADRTAPIEEGTLIGSRTVDTDRDQLRTAIAYDTPYAVRQHEDQSLQHDPGRRAKWLEHTLKENTQELRRFLARRLGWRA